MAEVPKVTRIRIEHGQVLVNDRPVEKSEEKKIRRMWQEQKEIDEKSSTKYIRRTS